MREKLIELLKQASDICSENISNADNIDLHQMCEDLDSMIDNLNEIGEFEVYEE